MSGEMIWWTIGCCAAITAVTKAIGPVALGGRDPSPRLTAVIALMAPALIAALVLTNTFARGEQWHVDAHTIGVGVGGGLLLLKVPLIVAVFAAAAVTAVLRAIS